MIRQTTTLPLVEPDPPARRRVGPGAVAFVLVELALLASVPILAVLGFRALLDTRSGQFQIEPTPVDPGWQAFVDPTPLSAIVEVLDGSVTGVTVVIPATTADAGGAVVLVPGGVEIEGQTLRDRTPEAAARAVGRLLRLAVPDVEIGTAEAWAGWLGGGTVSVANPDPVPGLDGEVAIPVGQVDLDGTTIPRFLGAIDDGNEAALDFRKTVFWRALLDAEPAGEVTSVVGDHLTTIASGDHRIEPLPTSVGVDGSLLPSIDAVDELIGHLVPLPRGGAPGDRLPIRIVDRTGEVDLPAVARNLGSAGFEVTQIGNALVFDDGPTTVIPSIDADPDQVAALAAYLGAATVSPENDEESVATVTVLLGRDFRTGAG